MENTSNRGERPLNRRLPWLVAAASFGVYLWTLNRSLSLANVSLVTSVAGWDWQPPVVQPLLFLLTVFLGWLPDWLLPLTLNALSAVCGGLTLGLLARSVLLLPRDRVPIHRAKSAVANPWALPLAWLPPLLAVLGCGLQLTFWEHATGASGDLLDLLLFAYVIRCLLEFRARLREAWLVRAVLVAALAVTNNWAMIPFLPLLLLALIWLRGIELFSRRFLLRLALAALGGLSLYLLQPLIVALLPDSPMTFWKALRYNLGSQLGAVRFLSATLYYSSRDVAVLLSLVSLLPLLFMSIRWKSLTGEGGTTLPWLVLLPVHFAHAVFLTICLWVLVDPTFSPREAARSLGGGLTFLPLYYLAALSVGYYSSYFLQRFGQPPAASKTQFAQQPTDYSWIVRGCAVGLLVLVPALLLLKNIPLIRNAHSDLLPQFARTAANALPPGGGVILSDDPVRLRFVQAALAQQGRQKLYVPVDTRWLDTPGYQRFLHRRYPKVWPPEPALSGATRLDTLSVFRNLQQVARSNTICYLHPSFGYFFEAFCPEPRGLVTLLGHYPPKVVAVPPMTPEVLRSNLASWQRLDTDTLASLAARMGQEDRPARDLRTRILEPLKVRPEPNYPLWMSSSWYSRALNTWGTQLQRNGRLAEASQAYRRALELKPDNLPAVANLFCATNLLAGKPLGVDRSRSPESALGRYRGWEQVLGENGPFDAPEFCFVVGQNFATGNLYRQAAQQFERAAALAPDFLTAKLMLANVHNLWGNYDTALELTAALRTNRAAAYLPPDERVEVDIAEATARLGKGDDAGAQSLIGRVLASRTNDLAVMDRIFSLYISRQQFSNALEVVGRQLRVAPRNPALLVNEGYVWLQLGKFSNALPPLTRVLALDTNNVQGRFNRAITYLNLGQFEESRTDYRELEKLTPGAPQIQYGLAEIAYLKHETNTAITHYTRYLTNAAPDTAETRLVQTRLQELRGGHK
jgi:tetratricopeptide (TPR) repeat protein